MKGKREIIILFLGIFLLVGCSAEKKVTTSERVIPATRLLRKMEGNRRIIKTFHGTGTIKVKSEEFTGKTSFEIFIKKPDSIRISIYGPFGIDLAHLLFTDKSFQFYDVLHNKVYLGQNNKNVFQKLFKIDLSFDDLIDSFVGAINLTDKLRKKPDSYKILEDIYLLTYIDKLNNNKSQYRIAKDDLRILDYSLANAMGKEILSGEYGNFKDYSNVPIPTKLFIRNKSKHQSLNVVYKKIEVNKKIKSLLIDFPTDIKKIKW